VTAPTAQRSGPVKGSLERAPPRSRVYSSLERAPPRSRAHDSLEWAPPRSRVRLRLARGLPHTHARPRTRVRAFNVLTRRGQCHHAPGNHARALLHQLPRGTHLCYYGGTVRHGQCQPRDTALPTPVRLTRRALEGGPATPSNRFLVILQGQVVTLGRRDAIPATVDLVRPPYLQHHASRCCNHFGTVRHAGTGRRHACHCTPYGSTSTATSSPSEDATVNHYAPTLEASTVRVQDAP
jgi:hypothetical protein